MLTSFSSDPTLPTWVITVPSVVFQRQYIARREEPIIPILNFSLDGLVLLCSSSYD